MEMNLVVLLGAARSGTTFLGRNALSRCRSVTYWGEPYYVWSHGHAYRSDDVLSLEDATPSVKAYIRSRFTERMAQTGNCLMLEKTPSNCLRIPFIREVFPEARFINLVRDGREAIRSTVLEWRGQGTEAHDSKHLREGGVLTRVGRGARTYLLLRQRVRDITDLCELPAYGPRFLRFFMRNVRSGRDYPWGPRFPGMTAYRKSHTLWETCSEQWRWQVQSVLDHTADMGPDQLYQLRFEELMTSPREQLQLVMDWMGVTIEPAILGEIVASVRPGSGVKRDSLAGLSPEERRSVENIIRPVMVRLGYGGAT